VSALNGTELICLDTRTGVVLTPHRIDFSGVSVLGVGGAAVASVFGRTGIIVATQDDYSFTQLSGKPTTLAGYGITDPIVLTSGSYSNPAWITSLAWTKIASKPTTLAGYGITDGLTQVAADARYSLLGHTHTFASLTSKPTTLAGYGITDAQPLDADLTAIAALATTSYGQGFLPLANAAAARTYIGVAAGIPAGGTQGQVLMKNSAADYDVIWADVVTPT
jgi:hypothetical protein